MRAVRPSTDPISSTTSADSEWSTATLVGDGQGRLEALGPLARLLGEACVRGDHDQIGERLGRDCLTEHGECVEVIDGNLEEALHLGRMQIEGDDAVDAGGLDGVGADPRPDGDARLVLLVALGVAEVGDHCGDRCGARPLEGIDPEEQLHEVVVGRKPGALDEENVATPHVLEDPDEEISLGEPERLTRAEVAVEIVGDGAAQLAAG